MGCTLLLPEAVVLWLATRGHRALSYRPRPPLPHGLQGWGVPPPGGEPLALRQSGTRLPSGQEQGPGWRPGPERWAGFGARGPGVGCGEKQGGLSPGGGVCVCVCYQPPSPPRGCARGWGWLEVSQGVKAGTRPQASCPSVHPCPPCPSTTLPPPEEGAQQSREGDAPGDGQKPLALPLPLERPWPIPGELGGLSWGRRAGCSSLRWYWPELGAVALATPCFSPPPPPVPAMWLGIFYNILYDDRVCLSFSMCCIAN